MNRREFFHITSCAAAGMWAPSLPVGRMDGTVGSLPFDVDPDNNFFVATNGDDQSAGTQERPFATLFRAREAVRELKKQKQGPITVWVREGTYYLPKSLRFEPADSGTPEQTITCAAHPGERVTLSGGRKIACHWEPFRHGIMKCALPAVKAGELDFTQLFVNGKRQVRARYPNYDPKNPLVWGNGYIDVGRDEEGWPPTEFHFNPETFTRKRWARPQEAVVHLFPLDYWGNLQW